jgi:hypothetical protein
MKVLDHFFSQHLSSVDTIKPEEISIDPQIDIRSETEIEIDGFPEIDLIDRVPSMTYYCRDCECSEGMDW